MLSIIQFKKVGYRQMFIKKLKFLAKGLGETLDKGNKLTVGR